MHVIQSESAAERPSVMRMFTPARRRGVEILDDPSIAPDVRQRSIDDVVRSNRLFGGLRAAVRAFQQVLPSLGASATLLDVGTGLGDIPAHTVRAAREAGCALTVIGVDGAASLLGACSNHLAPVCADAMTLPFRDSAFDVVMCSQLLHHFADADAERLVREMNRVARRAVIVSDLRRSWLAACGFWLASWPLRFHRVTRHDGVVSVLRGFTAADLTLFVRNAAGVQPTVEHWLGFRLTARWTPPSAA
jgi:SAM-dependent methyltransferase